MMPSLYVVLIPLTSPYVFTFAGSHRPVCIDVDFNLKDIFNNSTPSFR